MTDTPAKWHHGITRLQWLVLAVASAGWLFDVFEGQLFNFTRADLLAELLRVGPDSPEIKRWGDIFVSIFLLGGTLGGCLFSSLADKWGRKPVMALTILLYSLFSGLTAFTHELWQVGVLRFLVAMGVGGEWAVGAALVAEIFPKHARAHASAIYHASSILGLWLAAGTSLSVGTQWRTAYLVGFIPAFVVYWMRSGVCEPSVWKTAKLDKKGQLGSYRELMRNPLWRKHALLGMALSMVGLATFWGVAIAGQDLCRDLLISEGTPAAEAATKAKFAYGIVESAGGGLGLFAFGPLSVCLGRKKAFAFMHIMALITVPMVCYLPHSYGGMLAVLPIFGFFTIGIHAGYAVYFPELFPSHLRATGAGFCFNTGRFLAAPVLLLSGNLKAALGNQTAIQLLSLFFLLGLVVLVFLPETKNRNLPD